MQRLRCSTLGVLSVLACLLAAPARAQLPEHRAGELLVKFRSGADPRAIDRILSELGGERIRSFSSVATDHIRISRQSVEQAIERYQGHAAVDYLEPNYIYRADRIPDDPDFPRLWGMRNRGQTGGTAGADVSAADAWDVFTGSSSVVVAIIDTGIDVDHPDLAANVFVNHGEVPDNQVDDDGNGFIDDVHGWDFFDHDNDPFDLEGHGTHVAGICGAVGNNGRGVTGINWNVQLLPIRFLGPGGGTTAGAIASIEYAIAMGARVINASWGGSGASLAMRDAIQRAQEERIVFAAAAGNSGSNTDASPHYPASFTTANIVAVAATDQDDVLADFSNFGRTSVDLAAPGRNILSTTPGNAYGQSSGTSMATPHVAGALALIMGRFPGIGPLEAKDLLLDFVDPVPTLQGFMRTGGRLNAFLPIAEPDSVPPGLVLDLRIAEVDGNRVRLAWTSSGDDGSVGTARHYDLRYSVAPIDPTNFAAAPRAQAPRIPLPAGEVEEAVIEDLGFATVYYFAIKVLDEFRNASPISNLATATTLGPPEVAVSPEAIGEELITGQSATRIVTLVNNGPSDLTFELAVERANVPAPIAPPSGGAQREAVAVHDGPTIVPPYAPAYDRGRTPRWPSTEPNDTPIPSGLNGDIRILLVWSGLNITAIRSLLESYPDIAAVDVFDAGGAIPALADLMPYDVVILITNRPYLDSNAVGNVVADYADAGGGVIMTLATFIPGFRVGGRFLAERYAPFSNGTGPPGFANLGEFDAAHPIMRGVTTAAGDLLARAELDPEADLIASWDRGQPFVAVKGSNVVAVNIFLDGGPWWSGDLPLVLHNAAVWASDPTVEWLRTAPVLGTIRAGDRRDVAVIFDAHGLIGGDYQASMVVNSNDPGQPVLRVPVHAHVTGAPDIVLSESIVGFRTVFLGTTMIDTITVSNPGTDLLSVGRMGIEHDAFEVEAPAFSLVPGESLGVAVSFTPRIEGPTQGFLTIESDDPDEPMMSVPVRGSGLPPPVVAVARESLSVSLLADGRSMRTLEVQNRGRTDLDWRVAFDFDTGPGGSPRQPDRLANSFVVFHDDMEHGANGWTHYSTFSNQVDLWDQTTERSASGAMSWNVAQHAAAGSDALQSPEIDLSLYADATLTFNHWYNFDDCGGNPNFEPDGGIVEISTDGGTTWEQIVPVGDYPFRIDNSCDNPLRFHPAYAHDGGDGAEFISAVFDLTPYARQRVILRFQTGWDCGNCQTNDGWYIDDVTVESQSPTWLSASPLSGTAAADQASNVSLTFDAASLAVGRYAARVDVISNDPETPVLVLPMELNVVEALCGLSVEVTAEPDVFVAPPVPGCDAFETLERISFVYTGGLCSTSTNGQGDEATCVDLGPLDERARVLYVGPHLDDGVVSPSTAIGIGDTVTVMAASGSALGDAVELLILEPERVFKGSYEVMNRAVQSLAIHTSCSKPLAIGDVFGALTIIAINGKTASAQEVTYTYTMTNHNAALTRVSLTDDRLGLIAEELSIARDETRTFIRKAEIVETTTSTVTVNGQLSTLTGDGCSLSASTTVTVLPPSETCTVGRPRALVFEYTGESCSASRHGQGNRAKCRDHAAMGEPVRVVYAGSAAQTVSVLPSDASIRVGDQVVIAAIQQDFLESQTPIEIWHGETVVQKLDIHTSCARRLSAGDQFGSLILREYRISLEVTDAPDPESTIRFALGPSFPNPARGLTTIRYALAQPGHVRLTIHDVQGRLVATVVDAFRSADRHAVTWNGRGSDGRSAAPGLYLMRLTSAEGVRLSRFIMLK